VSSRGGDYKRVVVHEKDLEPRNGPDTLPYLLDGELVWYERFAMAPKNPMKLGSKAMGVRLL
jgi:hypothetical protein